MSNTIYLYLKTHNKTGLKYLGKTIRNPYTYNGSGKYWLRHIKKHGCDINTQVLLETNDPEEIKKVGLRYSEEWDVVNSDQFANLMNETGAGGHNPNAYTEEARNKLLRTISSEEWRETVGKEASNKMKLTRNDPEWRESIGKESHQRLMIKRKETMNTERWQEEKAPTWKENLSKSVSATKNSLEWKNTKGKEASMKDSMIKNDTEWREKVGKPAWEAARIKQIETKSTQSWRDANIVSCEHCGKKCDVSNHKRWHGDNCSLVKPREITHIKDTTTCPYCNTIGKNGSAMKRWHFNNCKEKKL
jgi:hypothetical protein